MHQHDTHADEPQEDDILHDLLFQLVVDHGVAAVLDDDYLAGVAADVGQGGGQDFRTLHVGQIIVHAAFSFERYFTSVCQREPGQVRIMCGNPH